MVKILRASDGKIVDVNPGRILKDDEGYYIDLGNDEGTCGVDIIDEVYNP